MAAKQGTPEAHAIAESTDVAQSFELVVYERQQRRVYRLPESGVVSIGRAANSDVRLAHDSVSRRHALLHLPSLEVEDLQSRNGSWVLDNAYDTERGSGIERIAKESSRLPSGTRCAFPLGSVLMLGDVMSHVQRSKPVDHALLASRPPTDEAPVLEDPAMVELYALAKRAAMTPSPVLLLGEPGVGKDVLAAQIHHSSPRHKGPFVRLHCGGLPELLIESELFGHQRGAFVGAHEAKPGLFELGRGGTLFLEDVAELSLSTQTKLLQVLEAGEVTRLGSSKPVRVDVRLVTSTHHELVADVRAGKFKRDLHFRLSALSLKINPLRHRKADVLPLARHFLRRVCQSMGVSQPELSPEAVSHLVQYNWPGNVRELKNSVERARLLCGHGPLLPQHFPTERELLNPAPDMEDVWASEVPTAVCERPSYEPDVLRRTH